MPDALTDARRLIESRLAEIETEAKRLERAVAGMGEKSPRRGRPSKRSSTRACGVCKPDRRRPVGYATRSWPRKTCSHPAGGSLGPS
jgi:hypothetical protein